MGVFVLFVLGKFLLFFLAGVVFFFFSLRACVLI